MASQPILKKIVLILAGSLLALFVLFVLSWPDYKLHLVFCDVGQGDAILLISPSGKQVLVDGGPDSKVLTCLGKKMPFWDRKIEMVILTHPQADHMVGLIEVLKDYRVDQLVVANVTNSTAEYQAWQRQLESQKSKLVRPKQGEVINFGDGVEVQVLWPIDGNYPQGQPADLNDSSIILRLNYHDFCALLTGDAPKSVLETIAQLGDAKACTVLKVPHHGSKNSLADQFLNQVGPQIAVISSGRNNRFGHPHKEVLDKLAQLSAKVLRTDQLGTIDVTTDGSKINIR